MLKFVGAFLAAFFISAGFAQQYKFINYSVADGLAQSQVTDICQDKYGYLWVGTGAGLSRFDGISFKNYSVDDGLLDNYITSLYYDNNDVLWMSTPLGVSKFENQEIVSYPFDVQYRVNDIAEFNGELYFASTTGLLKMEGQTFSVLGGDEGVDYYHRAVVNYKDSILICGSRNGLFTWDGEKYTDFKIDGAEDFNVRDLYIHGGLLYVTDRKLDLFTYDIDTKEVKYVKINRDKPQSVTVYEGGIFGITVKEGAFLIEGKDTIYFDNKNGFNTVNLECLYRDVEGNLWLGTDTDGLLKFTGTSVVSFSHLDGFESEIVLGVGEKTSGELIFGTYNEGIYGAKTNLNNGRLEFERFDLAAPPVNSRTNRVWEVFIDSLDREWLGTSLGLIVLDNERNNIVDEVLPVQHLGEKIRTIESLNGSIFLGGDEGIIILNNEGYLKVDSLNVNKMHFVDDVLYVATAEGLFKSEEGDYTNYSKVRLPAQKVNTLTSDYDGNLWIGTENGLFLKHEEIVSEVILERSNDYRAKNIFALISSEVDSSIWIGCMKGVYQISPVSIKDRGLYKVTNFGLAEGLIDEEVNQNALYEDAAGKIWIGTSKGLAMIDMRQVNGENKSSPPLLHINGLRLFMEEFDYLNYKTVLDESTGIPSEIVLPHNKNHVTFDFIGINFVDPLSVQYEYRLQGVGENWSPLTKSTYATYSFLQPGDYIFQVRALNKEGYWSNTDEVHLIILPPFWKTWWFIAIGFVVISIIIVLLFQTRISAIKQKQATEKLDMKNRLLFLEQRSLNASMNRHFIFNSLNSIQYFINGSDKLAANRFLTNFAKLIRKNLDSSASNNFIVTLQEEVERIELYLSLEKMRFSEKFDYVVDVSSSLDTESIEIPSMILQPFVENSIIHGVLALDRKGEIKVRIYQEFGEVIFEVTDNGMGIDNSLKNKQNAIAGDHESKGVEITNRRIELLRKLTGENLLIIGPFQMNDEDGNCLGTKVIMKLGGTEQFEE